MEREFKWDAFGALQDAVLMWALDQDADGAKMTEMDARYFDTADGALSAEKTALRLRRENEESVCCLKLRGGESAENGLHAHAEYECPATCIAEGLSILPERGAPLELCSRLRGMTFVETCRITFSRYTVMLRRGGAVAELALDRGWMSAGGRGAPLCEIELEHKDGPEEAFLAMGQRLMREFRLRPQPLSKLARARALAEQPERPQAPERERPGVLDMMEIPGLPGQEAHEGPDLTGLSKLLGLAALPDLPVSPKLSDLREALAEARGEEAGPEASQEEHEPAEQEETQEEG